MLICESTRTDTTFLLISFQGRHSASSFSGDREGFGNGIGLKVERRVFYC